jgi:excisionase family DNA binding protein
MSDVDPLLTAAEVAARLRVRPAWVLAEARAGRLAHYRLNRKVRFTPAQVEAFLVARLRAPAPARELAAPSVIPAALFPPARGSVASPPRARSGACAT